MLDGGKRTLNHHDRPPNLHRGPRNNGDECLIAGKGCSITTTGCSNITEGCPIMIESYSITKFGRLKPRGVLGHEGWMLNQKEWLLILGKGLPN